MSHTIKILSILLLFLSALAHGQGSISFANITVDAAKQRANIEGKNIFIDAYAPWCGPCKIMDRHFKDKEIANYFNRNFINVKVDTDSKYGKLVSAKYGITFLPTILILDKDGRMRFKVDRLMSKDELLSIAKYAIDGPKYPKPTAPTVSTTSIPKREPKPKKEIVEKTTTKSSQQQSQTESNEKILYVLDPNATDLPPEILFEEAYFRVQLNDGTHKEAASKYLATQDDWFTEKNIKFIFDFLYDTESEEFDFFITNRSTFEKYIGQDKISQSLKILIENKLYQGIPRPDFAESQSLLALLDSENALKNNYHYFLNRLFAEGNEIDFYNLSEEYFTSFENPNQEITLNYITKKLESTTQKGKLKSLANLLTSIVDPDENYQYFLCSSKVYLALSQKQIASTSANKAIELAKLQKIDYTEASMILQEIKEL